MNHYNTIPVWENRRRVNELMEFQKSVVGYFNSLNRSPAMARPSDGEESGKYRREINLAVAEVRSIVRASRRAVRVRWTPPPAIGGPSRSVELFDDIFLLDQYDIPPSMVVDELDRAIGVYETDRRNSIFRTFNPLWWIGNLAGWLAGPLTVQSYWCRWIRCRQGRSQRPRTHRKDCSLYRHHSGRTSYNS